MSYSCRTCREMPEFKVYVFGPQGVGTSFFILNTFGFEPDNLRYSKKCGDNTWHTIVDNVRYSIVESKNPPPNRNFDLVIFVYNPNWPVGDIEPLAKCGIAYMVVSTHSDKKYHFQALEPRKCEFCKCSFEPEKHGKFINHTYIPNDLKDPDVCFQLIYKTMDTSHFSGLFLGAYETNWLDTPEDVIQCIKNVCVSVLRKK